MIWLWIAAALAFIGAVYVAALVVVAAAYVLIRGDTRPKPTQLVKVRLLPPDEDP